MAWSSSSLGPPGVFSALPVLETSKFVVVHKVINGVELVVARPSWSVLSASSSEN